jgi:hypothetical protein
MNKTITEKSLAPYQKSVSLILEEASNLTIKNEEEIKEATDILSRISTIEKRVKAEKEKLTKPATEIIKWARSVFSPIEKNYKEAEYIIKDKMILYNQKLEEKNRKKLEAISKKVEEGKIDIDKASENIESLKTQNSYKGEEGGIQFKTLKKLNIIDESKLPRIYLIPNERKIKEALINGIEVPGAEIINEKIVAKR